MKIKSLVACVMLQVAIISSIYSMDENDTQHSFDRSNSNKEINLDGIQNKGLKRVSSNDEINYDHKTKTAYKIQFNELKDLVEVTSYTYQIPYKLYCNKYGAKYCNTYNYDVILKQFCQKGEINKEYPTIINAININNEDVIVLYDKSGIQCYYSLQKNALFPHISGILKENDYVIFEPNLYYTPYTDIPKFHEMLEQDFIIQYIPALLDNNSATNYAKSDGAFILNNNRFKKISYCALKGTVSISNESLTLYYGQFENYIGKYPCYYIVRNTPQGMEYYYIVQDLNTKQYYFMLQPTTSSDKVKLFNNIEDIIDGKKDGKEIDINDMSKKYRYVDTHDEVLDYFQQNKISYKETQFPFDAQNINQEYATIFIGNNKYTIHKVIQCANTRKHSQQNKYAININGKYYDFVVNYDSDEKIYCYKLSSENKYYKNIEDILSNNETCFDTNTIWFDISDNSIFDFIQDKNLQVKYINSNEDDNDEDDNDEDNIDEYNIDDNNINNIEMDKDDNEINENNYSEKEENEQEEQIFNDNSIGEQHDGERKKKRKKKSNKKPNNETMNQNNINKENNNNNEENNLDNNFNEIDDNNIIFTDINNIDDNNNINNSNKINNINEINNIKDNNEINKINEESNDNNKKEQNKELDNALNNLKKVMFTWNKLNEETVTNFVNKLSTDNEYRKKLKECIITSNQDNANQRKLMKTLKKEFFSGKNINLTPDVIDALISYGKLLSKPENQ